MAKCDLDRRVASVAEAEKVGMFYVELFEEFGDVVGVLFEGGGGFAVRGTAVRLTFEGDNFAGFGKQRHDAAETRLDRRASAVDEHQRLPAAVELVIHF